MLTPVTLRRFEKDVDLALRRGKDLGKLQSIVELLVTQQPLPPRLRDHKLVGTFSGRRECHIEPDWLLIYRIDEPAQEIIFERTGTHADLF
jgi:mRNA interferase YafQ